MVLRLGEGARGNGHYAHKPDLLHVLPLERSNVATNSNDYLVIRSDLSTPGSAEVYRLAAEGQLSPLHRSLSSSVPTELLAAGFPNEEKRTKYIVQPYPFLKKVDGPRTGPFVLGVFPACLPEKRHLMLVVDTSNGVNYPRLVTTLRDLFQHKDPETFAHSQRVAELVRRAGEALLPKINSQLLCRMERGGFLHDIGKLDLPQTIIDTPAGHNLSREQRDLIREHPRYAVQVMQALPELFSPMEVEMVGYHQEKWDGTGYPHRLRGGRIPLPARVLALADTWDAMRSDRPYRRAMPANEVRSYFTAQKGHAFDPFLVDAFLEVVDRIEQGMGYPV